MSPKGRIELVCFDLGGVLVRIRSTWADACHGAALEVRGDTAGEQAERVRHELSRRHTLGEISIGHWILALGQALGGLYSPQEIAAIHDAVLIDEYPGIDALIDELHRGGVTTACLSNTNDAHWAKLVPDGEGDREPGAPRYPAVGRLGSHYVSHLLGLAKPAPAIYHALEKATGRAGGRILFFDDRAENIAAARAVGWRAEQIDPTTPTDKQMRRLLAVHGVL
jgi:FMN phosphatase YigB (HAD superfamily)